MTEFLRHSLDMSVVNLRALMDSKDPAASVRLQAEFVNAAADRLFRQQARLSEIALQTATDAWTVVMARAEEALAS
jgi:phasin family protein